MPEARSRRALWHAIGAALVAFVVYQSLTPAPLEVELGEGNRLGHLAAYGTLMGWYSHLHERRITRIPLALGFVAMGVLMEFIQGTTGYRMFDPADAIANAVGVCLGWLMAPPRLPNLLAVAEHVLDRPRI